MQDRYIAAVDLGSSKISLCVAKVEGQDIQVHYYKELPSEGIMRGTIRNPKKVSNVLKSLINNANEELGISIMQLVVALPRYRIDQEQDTASIKRTDPDTAITSKEINEFVEVAIDNYKFEKPEKRKIYGAIPQSFSVEDQSIVGENDVVGVYSDFIEGHFVFFLGDQNSIKGITYTLNEAGQALAKDIFVPTTTASAVLTEDEKESGVALIEVGGDVTSVTIYKGKRLKYYGSIPFGGNTITNDIKNECGFSFKLAENIKLAYGSCTPNNLNTLSEKIIQINNESGSFDRLTVKYLAEIIEERCKELIDAVLYMIDESGFSQDLRKGVVLTGGGSKLAGFKSMISLISGYDVRLGYPSATKFRVAGAIAATELSASATMGMILKAARDVKLNCIKEIELEVEEETEESEQTAQKETHYSEEERKIEDIENVDNDTLKDILDWDIVEPKKGKKRREKKPDGLTWQNMMANIVKKVGIVAEKAFDATVGDVFDEMTDE